MHRRVLLRLFLLALAVRLLFIAFEPPTRRVGDERTWVAWGIGCPGGVACDKVGFSPLRTHLIFYPPLYPYFIATLHTAFDSLIAVQVGQALLGAALAVFLAILGARLFGSRTGTVAGLVTALYPDLVWFAAHYWSETVFMALLWWGMERIVAADQSQSARVAAAAGLVWGLAILTRETVLYFVPVVALWLAFRNGTEGRKRAAAFVLTTVLTFAPWTYRNWVVLGAFIPVSTAGGQNLFQGNTHLPRDETYVMVDAVKGRVEQYRYATRMGLEAIRDRQPTWIFEKLYEQMPNFWETDSLTVIHVKRGAYWPVSVPMAWAVWVLMGVPYLLVLGGFLWGLLRLPLSRGTLLLLAFLAYTNAIHIVTHGFARYRLPAMPVLILIAAWAFVTRNEGRPVTRGRTVAVGGLALALFLSLLPSVEQNVGHRAFGGTKYPRPAAPAPPVAPPEEAAP
jgi:4-amino-4-deoxy-L-arabinose transferase-like glycosyltransferase